MATNAARGICFEFFQSDRNGSVGHVRQVSAETGDRWAAAAVRRDQGGSRVRGVGNLVRASRSPWLIQTGTCFPGLRRREIARSVAKVAGCAGLCALTAWSAILMKEAHAGNGSPVPALVAMSEVQTQAPDVGAERASMAMAGAVVEREVERVSEQAEQPFTRDEGGDGDWDGGPGVELWPVGTRFFNGRPIRPVRTMKMVVTAYSPDARSCGEYADGRTATLHSVDTNAHRLVAADPRVLAYGSMLTIPGYDNGHVVPVLDCGGAIKGNRLDLLFPTHEQARKWGRKTITVTVWGYADGKPAPNPRKARDGRAH